MSNQSEKSPLQHPLRSRRALALALSLFGIVLALCLLELSLRVVGLSYPTFATPDATRGHALRPGMHAWQNAEGNAYVEISSAGLRDREHPLVKPAGTYRIALLGDSYAEALQVALPETFWWQTQERLRTCAALQGQTPEVINFGVGGYGTAQQLLTLRDHVWQYQPDMVALAFTTSNDISDNLRELKQDPNVPYFVLQGDALTLDNSFLTASGYRFRSSFAGRTFLWLVRHLRTLQVLNRIRHVQRQDALVEQRRDTLGASGDSIRIYEQPKIAAWERAWEVTEALLRQVARESQQGGAAFALISLSNPKQVHPDKEVREAFEARLGVLDLFYPERRLEALGLANAFPVLVLAPELRKSAERQQTDFHSFPGQSTDGHWNQAGHAAAAEIVAPRICKLIGMQLR